MIFRAIYTNGIIGGAFAAERGQTAAPYIRGEGGKRI